MVNFIYQCDHYSKHRELIARNFCRVMSRTIDLPESIEIELFDADPSVYGATILDHRFKNRIRINAALGPRELIHALTHELIHLNQVYTGKLRVMSDGSYYWNGSRYQCNMKTIPYADYTKLPWEVEVATRLTDTMNEALTKG